MRTLFIFLFVAIVSLIVYNPKMEDFKSYIDSLSQKEQFDQTRSSLITRMTEPDTVLAGSRKAGYTTERNNYLIFSTYRISLSVNGKEFEQSHFLGIAGMFFELGNSGPLASQP